MGLEEVRVPRYTDEELLERGASLREKLGRRVLLREYVEATGVSDATIRSRFGSWGAFSQQWQGESKRDETTRKASKARQLDAPVAALSAARVRGLERRRNYLVTSLTNNVGVEPAAWAAFLQLAEHRKAQPVVIPTRYMNPTSQLSPQDDGDDVWWPEEGRPFMVEQEVRLHEQLRLMAHVRIGATRANPLTGKRGLSKGESAIFGHPQLAMETVATPHHRLPKILYTTGSLSHKDYSRSDAGTRAAFHHSHAAIMVETRGSRFHMREVTWDGRGFTDLDVYATPRRVHQAARPAALVTGDEHAWWACPWVKRATYGPGGIVDVLRPARIIRHDVMDSYSISHHHDDLTRAVKAEAGWNGLEDELRETLDYVLETTPDFATTYVVASNHHDHVKRWLAGDKRRVDPRNLRLWHWLNWQVLEAATIGDGGAVIPDPFQLWARQYTEDDPRVVFLERDDTLRINGVELAIHGDRGPNGARGSRRNLSEIGTRSMIGHSHAPGIWQGVYQVGTSSVLRMEYNVGPSGWLNTHGLLHANGRRQLVHVIEGAWRG